MPQHWRVFLGFDRNVRLFLAAWALLAFGYFGVQAVLLNLYLLRLGFDIQLLGSLIASGQIVWALAALPAGEIGRRLGFRTALIAGCAISALGIGLLLLIEWLPNDQRIAWLYLCWLTSWLGIALCTVNAVPYLAHVTTAVQRKHAFVAQSAVMALAGFAGSVTAGILPARVASWIGGSLAQPEPYWYPLWLVPIAYLVCIVAWAKSKPPSVAPQSQSADAGKVPLVVLIVFGLVVFLQTASEGSVRTFFNVYLDKALQTPPAQLGLIFGLGQLMPMFMALVVPGLLARNGTSRVMVMASAGACLATIVLAAFPQSAAATVGFVGLMSMLAINGPSRNILSQELVLPRWRATSAAISTVGNGLGWAAAAMAGGYLIPGIGYGGLFGTGAALAVVAALVLWTSPHVRSDAST